MVDNITNQNLTGVQGEDPANSNVLTGDSGVTGSPTSNGVSDINTPQSQANSTTLGSGTDVVQDVIPNSTPKSEGANVYKEKMKVESIGSNNVLPNMTISEGINLIPTQTEEEIVSEKRKTGINYVSLVIVITIAVLSILIVGFNFVNRSILKNNQAQLTELESQVKKNSKIVTSNDAIIEKFDLYNDVQEGIFSPKEVLLYWQTLSEEFGVIDKIELTGGLNFTFIGKTDDLAETAKLWHLLSVDERVESIVLESVSTTSEGVSYSFSGKLDFDYFLDNSHGVSEAGASSASTGVVQDNYSNK